MSLFPDTFRRCQFSDDESEFEWPKESPFPKQSLDNEGIFTKRERKEASEHNRSHSISNTVNTCNSWLQPQAKNPLNVYHRNVNWMKYKDTKNKIKRNQKVSEEQKSCTFHPKTKSVCINQTDEPQHVNNSDFLKRNIEWCRNKQVKHSIMKKEKDQLELSHMQPEKKPQPVKKSVDRTISKRIQRRGLDISTEIDHSTNINKTSGYINLETSTTGHHKQKSIWKPSEKSRPKKEKFAYRIYEVSPQHVLLD